VHQNLVLFVLLPFFASFFGASATFSAFVAGSVVSVFFVAFLACQK
jgi:hypothetical protein